MNNKLQAFAAIGALFALALACNMSTANLSSLKTSKDKEGKQESTAFKAGDTIYGNAVVANSMSKVTVKYKLVADDVPGMKKGDTVKGSEVSIDLPSSGTANYSLPIPSGAPSGKFTLVADMHDEAGERKDGKTVNITIEGSSASTPAAKPPAGDDVDDANSTSDANDDDKSDN